MFMGIPEGRVRSMGGSHMGKVVPIILKLKLTVPIVVPIAIFYFSTFFGVKFSFSSLTP
jgi:hypothetical protein